MAKPKNTRAHTKVQRIESPRWKPAYTMKSSVGEAAKIGDRLRDMAARVKAATPGASDEERSATAERAMWRHLETEANRRTPFEDHALNLSLDEAVRHALKYGHRMRGVDVTAALKNRRDRSDSRRATPENASDEFDIPLVRAGVTAMLRVADLSNQEGADRYLTRFAIPNNAARPTLGQLQQAKSVLLAIEDTILSGADGSKWELIARAFRALNSTEYARRLAVGTLERLREMVGVYDDIAKRSAERGWKEDTEGPTLEDHVRVAMTELAGIDYRFGNVSARDVMALARDGERSGIGTATKLSLLCGAFGDTKRNNESEDGSYRRVRKAYEKVLRMAPPLR